MSQWNLSVQLTGQGSDLAATLRDSAGEASKLTDRINDVKRALAELRAEAANNINVRLDLDASHLRADVDAALADNAGRGITVRLDVDADHLRDDVTTALTGASTGQGMRVRLDLDADHLRDEVTRPSPPPEPVRASGYASPSPTPCNCGATCRMPSAGRRGATASKSPSGSATRCSSAGT